MTIEEIIQRLNASQAEAQQHITCSSLVLHLKEMTIRSKLRQDGRIESEYLTDYTRLLREIAEDIIEMGSSMRRMCDAIDTEVAKDAQ